MTQRSIHRPTRPTAIAAAWARADVARVQFMAASFGLAALVLVVVVLITSPHGAG